MKKSNVFVAFLLSASILVMSGCASMSNTSKGAIIGGVGGAAVGAGAGALIGKGKGAVIGAAIGGAVGAGAGALIGRKMDKQKAELAAIEGAKTQTVTDNNGLQAIQVTFDGGILFAAGKSVLSESAKTALITFGTSLKNNPLTDVVVEGHTDNTGSDKINQPLSEQRAASVTNFLKGQGVTNKITLVGYGSALPIGDNATLAGKSANRRVEIKITANAEMIKEAEAGTLK